MFDSVLNRGDIPKTRFGAGSVLSVALHVALVGVVLFLSTRPAAVKEDVSEVKFFAAAPPPPPPPPPPPAGAKQEKKPEHKPIKKPDTIIQPKEIPQDKPKEAEPEPQKDEPEEAEPAGVPGGVEGGVPGGVVGGVPGGTVGGVVGNQLDVVPFGEGMTRVEFDKAELQRRAYTREALEAQVQGTMIIKCAVLADGSVHNCRVLKPLPFLSESVIKLLESTRVKPVTFEGRPVSVDYVFNFQFTLAK